MDWLIGGAMLVIVATLGVSLVWWGMRRFGGSPMNDDEQAVPVARGSDRPHVFEGGSSYRVPGL